MRYQRITRERDLLDLLPSPDVALLCGGTDLIVKMRSGIVHPEILADISDLEPLRGIVEEQDAVGIGAVTCEAQVLESPIVLRHHPLLAMALAALGSVQIRQRGSLGGNLANASPAADSAIPLLLYDARLQLAGPGGERELPLRDFLVGPGRTALLDGEYIRRILVPMQPAPWVPFFHKIGKRRALTISIASLGALVRMRGDRVEKIRLAAGSVAPTPIRLSSVEAFLEGQQLSPDLIQEARARAMDEVSPIDDIRATAAYRREALGDLLVRLLVQDRNAA